MMCSIFVINHNRNNKNRVMHYTLGRFCLTESGLFQPGMILHIDIFRFFQHILCPSDLDMRATRQYDGVYAAILAERQLCSLLSCGAYVLIEVRSED